jgi:hypothetical protein
MLISNQDAVKQAQRLRAGEEVFDYLALETRAAKKYLSQCERRDKKKAARQQQRNSEFQRINRHKTLAFDGRWEGPLNKPITVVVSKVKEDDDRPHYMMNVGIVKHNHHHESDPVETQTTFNVVTPEDHDWATRQPSVRRLKSKWQAETTDVPELQRGIGHSGHGRRVTNRE